MLFFSISLDIVFLVHLFDWCALIEASWFMCLNVAQ